MQFEAIKNIPKVLGKTPLDKFRFFIVVCILLLPQLWAVQINAQENVVVELTPSKKEMFVGDIVTLSLTVTHPTEYRVIIPNLPQEWGEFEVRSQSDSEVTYNQNSTANTTQTIDVSLFSLGTFEIPELTLTLLDNNQNAINKSVPKLSLSVISILDEDDLTLRDIKSQANLPFPPLWPWIVIPTILILLVVLVAWRLYIRFKKSKDVQNVSLSMSDIRTPYERILDDISEIRSMQLLMQQQFKTHYTLASEALRRYLCGMYKVEALDQTTEELRIELIHVPITSTHARHAIGILRDCDLVKFARLVPDDEAAQELLNDIHNLVILTQPIKQSESNITNAKIVEEEIS